jgi:acetyl esterase/lipase
MRVALLALLSGCWGTMESFFAQDVVEMHFDVPYVAGTDNPRQYLDLYIPREVDAYPVAVFVHGGFWMRQDKSYFQPFVGLYRNVGIALAREGIGAAVINYRLVPDVTFVETFDDVVRAISWTQQHIADFGGDPTRMVMVGHSAGGHMTALAAFDDGRLASSGVDITAMRGYAPLSPILDLAALAASPPSSNAEIVATVFGSDLDTHSPRTYFKSSVAPVLVVLGGDDLEALLTQVPPAVDELVALGAPIEFELIPSKSHEDIVVDFDTGSDRVTPLLVPFIRRVTGRD